jgi:hypothetical protein
VGNVGEDWVYCRFDQRGLYIEIILQLLEAEKE